MDRVILYTFDIFFIIIIITTENGGHIHLVHFQSVGLEEWINNVYIYIYIYLD